jgi:hypothetical protein
MCRGGNTRSVAAKMILHRYFGHETLAVGWENNSRETLDYLFAWADEVVVMHESFAKYGPAAFTTVLHVGEDVWGNPFDEELQLRIFDLVIADPFLRGNKNPQRDAVVRKLRAYREKINQRNLTDAAI